MRMPVLRRSTRNPIAGQRAALAEAQELLIETPVDAGEMHACVEELQAELAEMRVERSCALLQDGGKDAVWINLTGSWDLKFRVKLSPILIRTRTTGQRLSLCGCPRCLLGLVRYRHSMSLNHQPGHPSRRPRLSLVVAMCLLPVLLWIAIYLVSGKVVWF